MPDLALDWQDDLQVSPSGDIATVDGAVLTQQRILRRLLTAVRSYFWHLEYGAGLIQKIGRVAKPANIQSIVRSQIALETSVARTPVPTTTVAPDPTIMGAYIVTISYFDNEKVQQTLTFSSGSPTGTTG